MAPKILVICGPTASGKTRMAAELARRHGGEVISADSMQIYRGMDIGTAKPTRAEMQGVTHHMIDVADPAEDYSVARYVAAAAQCADDVLARGKLPIVAGGTGLYIDSLLSGRTFAAAPTGGGYRAELQAVAARQGIAPLLEELRRVDPQAAARLHPNDEKRIIRALEVWRETGRTITSHNAETMKIPPRYDALTIGLNFESRADLCARINMRVDEMMKNGLAEEVRALLDAGLSPSCTAMQAIGYKELAAAIAAGNTMAAAAEEIKLRSRQYAKRQLSWFRRGARTHWILWGKTPNFLEELQNSTKYMEEFGLL